MIDSPNQCRHWIYIIMIWMPSLCLASPENALEIIDSFAELCEQLSVIKIHLRRMFLENHGKLFS